MFRKASSSNCAEETLGFNGRAISVSAVCLSRLSSVIKVMGSIRLNEGVEFTSIRSFPKVMGIPIGIMHSPGSLFNYFSLVVLEFRVMMRK